MTFTDDATSNAVKQPLLRDLHPHIRSTWCAVFLLALRRRLLAGFLACPIALAQALWHVALPASSVEGEEHLGFQWAGLEIPAL